MRINVHNIKDCITLLEDVYDYLDWESLHKQPLFDLTLAESYASKIQSFLNEEIQKMQLIIESNQECVQTIVDISDYVETNDLEDYEVDELLDHVKVLLAKLEEKK